MSKEKRYYIAYGSNLNVEQMMDCETPICPDCGTRQALTSIGIDAEEQEKILDAIHRSMYRCTQDKA